MLQSIFRRIKSLDSMVQRRSQIESIKPGWPNSFFLRTKNSFPVGPKSQENASRHFFLKLLANFQQFLTILIQKWQYITNISLLKCTNITTGSHTILKLFLLQQLVSDTVFTRKTYSQMWSVGCQFFSRWNECQMVNKFWRRTKYQVIFMSVTVNHGYQQNQ